MRGWSGNGRFEASISRASVTMIASGSEKFTDENVAPTWNGIPPPTCPAVPPPQACPVDHSRRYLLYVVPLKTCVPDGPVTVGLIHGPLGPSYDHDSTSDAFRLRKSIWNFTPVPASGLTKSQFHIVCTESPT